LVGDVVLDLIVCVGKPLSLSLFLMKLLTGACCCWCGSRLTKVHGGMENMKNKGFDIVWTVGRWCYMGGCNLGVAS
jgi:hypothetical protein